MSGPVNQHKEYASTGKPSQEDTEYKTKEPPKTDFGEGARGTGNAPHSTESLLGEKG